MTETKAAMSQVTHGHCRRELATEFLRQLTQEYLSRWCTSASTHCLNLNELAESGRHSMEQFLVHVASTYDRRALKLWYFQEGERDEYPDKLEAGLFCPAVKGGLWFWDHYPLLEAISAHRASFTTKEMDVEPEDLDLNLDFTWKLVAFGLCLDQSQCITCGTCFSIDRPDTQPGKRAPISALAERPKGISALAERSKGISPVADHVLQCNECRQTTDQILQAFFPRDLAKLLHSTLVASTYPFDARICEDTGLICTHDPEAICSNHKECNYTYLKVPSGIHNRVIVLQDKVDSIIVRSAESSNRDRVCPYAKTCRLAYGRYIWDVGHECFDQMGTSFIVSKNCIQSWTVKLNSPSTSASSNASKSEAM